MSLYPCCIIDPKYSADDVLLQVGGDKLHLDGSMAVDSVFWPVLWAQLNKTGTHTRIHTRAHIYIHKFTQRGMQVHTDTHTQAKQRKTHKENRK